MSESKPNNHEAKDTIQSQFNRSDKAHIIVESAKMAHPLDEKNSKSDIDLKSDATIAIHWKPQADGAYNWPSRLYIWAAESLPPYEITTNIKFEAGYNCAIKEYSTPGIFKIKPEDEMQERFCLKLHQPDTKGQHGNPTEEPPTTITIGDEPPDVRKNK
jgi:hypothetical protein